MKSYEHYVGDLVDAEKTHYEQFNQGQKTHPYKGVMVVKLFDAIDNLRTAPMDLPAIQRLVRKTKIIEAAARQIEEFYKQKHESVQRFGDIRGLRLFMLNELHSSLVENARLQSKRRDNIFRAGMMVTSLVEEARQIYESKQKYLR
jgi:tRNA A37 N6-isopentenylltransferase MiaA